MQQQGQLFCHVCRTCPPDRTGPQERRSSGGLGVGFLGRGPYVAGVGVQVIRAGPCHTWAGPGPFFQGEPGPRVGAVPALFYRPNGMPIPPPKIGAWQGVGARFHRPLNGHGAAPGAASSLSRGRVAGANRREPKQGGLGPKSWPGRLQLDPMRAGLRQGLGLGGLSP